MCANSKQFRLLLIEQLFVFNVGFSNCYSGCCCKIPFFDHHLVEDVVHVLIIKADVEMISFVGGSSSQA